MASLTPPQRPTSPRHENLANEKESSLWTSIKFRIASWDNSVSISEQEASWTCPRCFYVNVDTKNHRCAVCGNKDTNRTVTLEQQRHEQLMHRQQPYNNLLTRRARSDQIKNAAPTKIDENNAELGLVPTLDRETIDNGNNNNSKKAPTTNAKTSTTVISESTDPSWLVQARDVDGSEQLKPAFIPKSENSLRPSNIATSYNYVDSSVVSYMQPLGHPLDRVDDKIMYQDDPIRVSNPSIDAASRQSRPALPPATTVRSIPKKGTTSLLYDSSNCKPPLSQHSSCNVEPGYDAEAHTFNRVGSDPDSSLCSSQQALCSSSFVKSFYQQKEDDNTERVFHRRDEMEISQDVQKLKHESGSSALPTVSNLHTQSPTRQSSLAFALKNSLPAKGNDLDFGQKQPLSHDEELAPRMTSNRIQDFSSLEDSRDAPTMDLWNTDTRRHRFPRIGCKVIFLVLLVLGSVIVASVIVVVTLSPGKNNDRNPMPPSSAITTLAPTGDNVSTTLIPTGDNAATASPSTSSGWILVEVIIGNHSERLGSSVSVGGKLGNWIAMASTDFVQIVRYNSSDMQEEVGNVIPLHNTEVSQVVLSADSNRTVVVTKDFSLYLYELQKQDWRIISNETIGNAENGTPQAISGDISGNGRIVATITTTMDKKNAFVANVHVWELDVKPPYPIMDPINFETRENIGIVTSYDGNVLALLLNDSVDVYRNQDGTWRQDAKPEMTTSASNMALSGDGKVLAVSTSDGVPTIYRYIKENWSARSKWDESDIDLITGNTFALSYNGDKLMVINNSTVTMLALPTSESGSISLLSSIPSTGFDAILSMPKNDIEWEWIAIGASRNGTNESGQVYVYKKP